MLFRAFAAAAAFSFVTAAARADCLAPAEPPAVAATSPSALPPDATRQQRVQLGQRCLSFQSIAGSLRLPDPDGKTHAEIAYVAYLLDDSEPAKRPVVFAINGGPGAGSVWLQLGALGPWRLPMHGLAPSTEPVLVPNEDTWLDFADLVFLDPPGAGLSLPREAKEAERTGVWSVEGDVDTLSEAIRRWLVAHGRLGSPKFVVGESYGGFRAPRIAKTLTSEDGVGLTGIILMSPVLDFGRFSAGPDNPFPYLTRLPSYAAALREEKGPVSRSDLADVESYATGEYLADWFAGPRDADAVTRKSARVAALTGLPVSVVRQYAGDLGEWDYLNARGRLKGEKFAFYDATIAAGATGADWPNALDPILPGYVPAMTQAITALYRDRLGWRFDEQYETLNEDVARHWKWNTGLKPPNALGDLAQELALDPGFRVLVTHGLTDVQAPYFETALELKRLPPFANPQRLTSEVYPGGHMFYSRDGSRGRLREDARKLIEGR